jgi:hypothetical protein
LWGFSETVCNRRRRHRDSVVIGIDTKESAWVKRCLVDLALISCSLSHLHPPETHVKREVQILLLFRVSPYSR